MRFVRLRIALALLWHLFYMFIVSWYSKIEVVVMYTVDGLKGLMHFLDVMNKCHQHLKVYWWVG